MTHTPDSDADLALDASEEQRLSEALQSAWSPRSIDPARHERLLNAALEDPFAPASPEELLESERFRQALEGQGEHADLALARALASAHAPAPVPEAAWLRASRSPDATAKRSNVRFVQFGALGAALSAAAAVLLLLSHQSAPLASAPAPDLATLAQSRSTVALFQEAPVASASSRIDRIASARSRELRDNQYALWGVR